MKLKWLKDKLGEKFYPIAHATGVVLADNKTLDSKLDEIDTEIGDKASKTELPTELPANGGNADTVSGHTVKSDVPENAVFTDTIYEYSALLGYDIYNLVSLKDARYQANKTWLSKDFIAPFDGFVFFMVQTDGTSGAFTQVFKEDGVLISDNQHDIADFNTWGCAYSMGISKGKSYYFGSYNNATTAFNKVMLCIRKKAETPTEYVPYAPSNVALAEETVGLDKRISDNSFGEVAGGKNLYNCGNEVGGINSDGSEKPDTDRIRSKGYIKVNSSTTYTASVKNKNTYLGIYLYDKEKKIISVFSWQKGNYTFKTTDITEYVRVTYHTDDDGSISVSDILEYQIEEGTTATSYEPYFPSNKMLMEEKANKSETTVNLFKPTLESTTVNGIVVTNNGDGTYTFNGTATAIAEIKLGSITLNPGIYKYLGAAAYIQTLDGVVKKVIHDEEFIITTEAPVVIPLQWYDPGDIATNVIEKPMITTNLNATYSDFVPYTGDSGSLNGDVADLRSSIYFEKEISLSKAQLIRNGFYSDINIISSLFLFGANGKFGLSRGYISLSIPVSFSKKDEIYIKLPYKQYGFKQDNLLPYIYKTVFCTQGDFNGKIIGTCNLSYYSGSDDEGISLIIDINDNYSFTDDNISSAYVDLRF